MKYNTIKSKFTKDNSFITEGYMLNTVFNQLWYLINDVNQRFDG